MNIKTKCRRCGRAVDELWDQNGDRWKLAIHSNSEGEPCAYSEASVIPGGVQVSHLELRAVGQEVTE